MKTLGNSGLATLVEKFSNAKAEARTVIGYAKDAEHIHYFEGVVRGTIVAPRGKTTFGWDPIFQPEESEKTFAEMSREEKNKISMRREAFQKLKEFLS